MKMVTFMTFHEPTSAAFYLSLLKDASIPAILENENAGSLGLSYLSGGIRLKVAEDYAEEARAFIEQQTEECGHDELEDDEGEYISSDGYPNPHNFEEISRACVNCDSTHIREILPSGIGKTIRSIFAFIFLIPEDQNKRQYTCMDCGWQWTKHLERGE
jgi:hypothetical protein